MHLLSTSAKHLLVLPGLQFLTALVYIYRLLKTESVGILTFVVLQLFPWRFFFPKRLMSSSVNRFLYEHTEVWMVMSIDSIGYFHVLLNDFVCLLLYCCAVYFPFSLFFSQEHECKLTQEIVALIDREIDLISREVKECNLEGLRKRICTLFLQYIKTPEFNPQVAGLIKVLFLFCSHWTKEKGDGKYWRVFYFTFCCRNCGGILQEVKYSKYIGFTQINLYCPIRKHGA